MIIIIIVLIVNILQTITICTSDSNSNNSNDSNNTNSKVRAQNVPREAQAKEFMDILTRAAEETLSLRIIPKNKEETSTCTGFHFTIAALRSCLLWLGPFGLATRPWYCTPGPRLPRGRRPAAPRAGPPSPSPPASPPPSRAPSRRPAFFEELHGKPLCRKEAVRFDSFRFRTFRKLIGSVSRTPLQREVPYIVPRPSALRARRCSSPTSTRTSGGATCLTLLVLTQAFFKSGESCCKLWRSSTRQHTHTTHKACIRQGASDV